MAWIGRKKIAFVPVYRPNARPPDVIPADWNSDILRRVLYDPDKTTGADKSLRTYIHAVSYGRADLDAVVMPMETVDQQDVPPNILEGKLGSQLRDQGCSAAAIVMLGGTGAGTGEASGFWARFVMAEGVGVWAMELTHVLTGYWDLYIYLEVPDWWFDNMACACGTHPCAFTKAVIGWLDESAIAQHPGGAVSYNLHSVGLVQPPPSGRSTAVRIGSDVPYFMVEARQMVDQFDAIIPNNGVIVYEVLSPDESPDPKVTQPNIQLRTRTPLTPGMIYTPNSAVTVSVEAAIPGGFSVLVTTPQPGQSPWTTVAEGSSTPGAPVTAVVTGPNRIALFIADPNGGIYTISGFGSNWGQWTTVAGGRSTPGAPVTAVVTGPNRIALFIADPNGGIYTISGFGTSWGQWTTVAEGRSTPGAPVTAVVTGPNRITLFLTDPNGGVYTISGFGTSWGQWTTVAQGSSTPGAPVTAVVTGQNRIALFIADPNGGVYTSTKLLLS